MNRAEIICKDESEWRAIRALDVTSTETAMLYGLSPYGTHFELYHRKKNKAVVELPENERMTWGKRLQHAIANGIAEDYGLIVKPLDLVYQRIVDARMGSSFDFEIVGLQGEPIIGDDMPRRYFDKFGPGLLEIKNVDSLVFKQQWIGDDKLITPPDHIEVQVQHQQHIRDVAWSLMGILVGGNRRVVIERERDRKVGDIMENRIRQFWTSVDEGVAPEPVFPGDAEFVATLYGSAEPGKFFNGKGNDALRQACAEYIAAGAREKAAKEDKETAKAKALAIIGDAESAWLDGYKISAGMVAEAPISYMRKAYRNWRVTAQKGS